MKNGNLSELILKSFSKTKIKRKSKEFEIVETRRKNKAIEHKITEKGACELRRMC